MPHETRRRRAPLEPAAGDIIGAHNHDTGHGSHPAQLDLFVSPGGRRQPDTSTAAEHMAPAYRASIKAVVRDHIRGQGSEGATTDQVWEAMPEALLSTLSRRVSDLAEDGTVVDSGRRRPSRRGAQSIVWVATEHAPRYSLEEIAEHLDEATAETATS